MTDTSRAFDAYEAIRHRLPPGRFPTAAIPCNSLVDIADAADAFLLDAFGVLNVGTQPIPGVADRIRTLRAMGKRVMVLTNAASYPHSELLSRYRALGYDFAGDEVISSRDIALAAMAKEPARRWGVMAPSEYGREELESFDVTFLGDDPADYQAVDGFLMLGSGGWTEARQSLLAQSLRSVPRPVIVGNPDLVAPRDDGLSVEPGMFAHRLADMGLAAPVFHGKPFGTIFDAALAALGPGQDPRRVVMVGDTLHTDILGGAAAGIRTALVTGYGALRGLDVTAAISASGIVPDFILPHP